ncbi:heme-binding protein [Flavilitoribacter nigricans DSM 23189 = NBRC 102662]|uniref:Heme-binding protein n=2 Tax=Flavilitoribacter TaxID=2762562 RepID=A0A2D0NBP1_FLAN2|nr:heme-binding protein [Flavilitoribacter nigricans DSM 23189 = NBRC 102662]
MLWCLLGLAALAYTGCQNTETPSVEEDGDDIEFTPHVVELDPAAAAAQAREIRENYPAVKILDGLELSLWASDSLSPDPIALKMDEQGRAYVTRAVRQKNSEFDIRGHRDWMTASISLQSVEDRREFLRTTFAPEKSEENEWLEDLNGDGSHDWKDLTVERDQILRLEDRDGDGVADLSRVFVESPHTEVTDVAGGVLPFGGDVYMAQAPDLWRYTDTDGDGMADTKFSLAHGYQMHIGFGAHGMSGVTYGPDGKIYWGIGDIGMNVTDRSGKHWMYPNQGVICRANPDGSDFEVFAAGLRNTHEFVFDDYGNLISVDNDGDHPGESERLVHIVNGSDTGWRINWQFGKYTDPDNNSYKVWMDEGLYKPRFEGQAAYITPCIRNYHNGPTGMVYYPGTGLNDSFKKNFLVVEFPGSPARANIYGFRLDPKGATFDFKDERTVINGVLATGMDMGPDGALYFSDWMEGWGTKGIGRVWKLDDPTQVDSPIRKEVQQLIEADFSGRTPAELGELLAHVDRRIRLKAQFELAKRGDDGNTVFVKASQNSDEQLARIHGIWGIGQLAAKNADYAEPLQGLLQDADPEIRAQAAKIIGDVRYAPAAESLIPLVNNEAPRVRFYATEALGRIAHKPAIPSIIEMLGNNNDEDAYLRHAGALALARIGDAAPVLALSNNNSRALRIAAVVALRRMKEPGIREFLKDQDEYIVTEAARAINDDFSIPEALPDLARLLGTTSFTNEALIRRAINANLRVGKEENLKTLSTYATKQGVPETMRAEAIATLGVWAKPSVLDRVDGRLRGPVERDLAPVQAALKPIIPTLFADKNVALQAAGAEAAGKAKLGEFAPQLFDMVQNHKDKDVRIAALQALADLEADQSISAIRFALDDQERDVRVNALRLVSEQDIPADELIDLFSIVLEKATIREQQQALRGLSELPIEKTKPLLNSLLDKLTAGDLPPGIQLELTEAIEESELPELLEKMETYRKSLDPEDVVAQYRDALEGGNPWRGRNIFLSHETSQCVRCHSLEPGEGSDVGPLLAGIGAKYDREELLRSLVAPSARIAPGYGVVVLTLSDGKTVSGILKEENDQQLVIQVGDESPQRIDKSKVTERIDAASSMPAMGAIMEREELRDLVAFLVSLGDPT